MARYTMNPDGSMAYMFPAIPFFPALPPVYPAWPMSTGYFLREEAPRHVPPEGSVPCVPHAVLDNRSPPRSLVHPSHGQPNMKHQAKCPLSNASCSCGSPGSSGGMMQNGSERAATTGENSERYTRIHNSSRCGHHDTFVESGSQSVVDRAPTRLDAPRRVFFGNCLPEPPVFPPKDPTTVLRNDNMSSTESHSSDEDQMNDEDSNTTDSAKGRRYKCEKCGKLWIKKHHLREHLRVHSRERPYGCEACGRKFRDSGSVRRHQRNHCASSDDQEIHEPTRKHRRISERGSGK